VGAGAPWYAGRVQREIKRFRSFDEAEAADAAYYASLSPDERVDVLLELIAAHQEAVGEATQGLARVCRVVELARG
jgi:hypothetical protein